MGRRGQGQGVSCTRIPGHSRATQPRQPVSASCTHYNASAVLVPRVPALCSQGDPSHREIQATGKSRSWGNPSHWDQGCICLPTATPLQAVMGHFQHRQKKSLATGKSCNLLSLRPRPRLCPVFLLISVSVVTAPPQCCVSPSALWAACPVRQMTDRSCLWLL